MGFMLRKVGRKLAGTPPELIDIPAFDDNAALIGEYKHREALARYTVGKPRKRDRDWQRSICP